MRSLRQMLLAIAAAGSVATAHISASHGQELKVGLSAEPSAMDPHFHNLTPNNSLLRHIFDRLTHQDENQAVDPGSGAVLAQRSTRAPGNSSCGPA